MMLGLQKNRAPGSSRRSHQHLMNLLLVGSEEVFQNNAAKRFFQGDRFQVVARSSTLLDAIVCLDSKAIDLVLLSHEYRREELDLFAFDARRRGFAGLILHAADAPGNLTETEWQEKSRIQIGDFIIDVSSRRVWIRGVETRCSHMEFELLQFLCRHPGELLSHGTMLESLWGNPASSAHALRVLVHSVRAKIETAAMSRYILTLRNFGYRFIPSPPPLQ